MICQECKQRPATMHFTKIINGEKTEFHLCEHCAQEHGDVFMFHGNAGFSLQNLLAGLLNFEAPTKGAKQNAFQSIEILQCERCNMTYNQFAKIGRFGCSHCYHTFAKQLQPILKRLHSGNTTHAGKIPRRIGGSIYIRKQIAHLKQKLQELIAREEFEKAAEVRDQIRLLESRVSKHGEEG
ncbi:uvrB/uvrC motif family protein [Anoxybacillus sp. B7M1]|uniref:UvrB/UvrC motif-containing protein n=1 Tax=Anoxybacteroides rupiense TaxID=311460 RepID=A0ABD5IY60_9BACL|nr:MULTISPECIES: UvrB/UvrC motif-containing protein [Anoxybacillus]ANB56338.1 uvrB/uvrC motif family protein [Anoxybacillus sp. B2M1]ANB65371.1 uvrB/uvrC motif family protein [Anoxybacillus sp. B7M1]KXG08702.1 Protein-arginine kinase activator protein [Anoxybacillus sp. P3H1B]MBS2772435.1 UvrB/UvrC motif-containing protein [Anoxybacillus rupiensis]MDE8565117.1 UvrB/UvrC motif-containing protein [Anoxybacillus rupiensis]